MSNDAPSDVFENARVEYCATHDAYLRYDNFSWQVGSVLVAGTFVFWGFLLNAEEDLLVLAGANVVVCLLMSAWLLYASHNREIYLWKLHRARQLEARLEMWQHRRFVAPKGTPSEYRLHWPPGHVLNYFIYAIVSLGGPTLVGLTKPASIWAWISILTNLILAVGVVWRAVATTGTVSRTIRNKEADERESQHLA